jgi:hypothetical protein
LRYVKEQTAEICIEACKHSARVLHYVDNAFIELCKAIIK